MSRRKRYSTKFKREAIRRCKEPGVTAVLVAEELGISTRQLRRWREAAQRHGEQAFPGEGNARDEELMRLKRKLAKGAVGQFDDALLQSYLGFEGREHWLYVVRGPAAMIDTVENSLERLGVPLRQIISERFSYD